MKHSGPIIHVAIKTPIDHLFDYLEPTAASSPIRAGTRVRVRFGRGETVGVVVGVSDKSEIALARLRPVVEILDNDPVIDEPLMRLLSWAAAYYQQPPGDVYAAALPKLLRSGRA
ncbi:MAG: primosomal protein N', partial [Gammaproteobacteria bacterium]|nr:primosomal protein N' [Gammaproteobacteria bacterium]